MTLAGQTLFISGGSRGIGLEIALRAARFGGIDVCVNNASAINMSGTEALEIKR
jgi:citronellol/citronellal dehydrogenase